MGERRPKVVFWPSVGNGLGIGNVLRCLTIGRAMAEAAETICCLPEGFVVPEGLTGAGTAARTDPEHLGEVLPQADAIVLDHQGPIRAADKFAWFRRVAPSAAIVALDYFYRDDDAAVDAIVNLNDFRATPWPDGRPRCEYHEGLEYAVIRPAFQAYRPVRAEARPEVAAVVITFGGEDRSGWTARAVRWLERYVTRPVDVTVILGALNPSRDALAETLANAARHRYRVVDHVSDIERHLAGSDVAFCGGGTTILEAAFLGKPAIALGQHAAERYFLGGFQRQGFLLDGLQEAIEGDEAEPPLRLFEEASLRRDLAAAGLRLVDGRGASRLAEVILDQARRRRQRPSAGSSGGRRRRTRER